jgi:arginyl-tRNA synthetase
LLEEKNLTYFQEEAKLIKTSLAGDEKDRVIIKKDGEYTYFFSDILYHQNKLKRADKIINIWGADHHGYVNRIKAICQLLGADKNNVQIILIQIVNLLTEEGKSARFSKRAGNTIELEEALTHLEMDQLKFFLLEKDFNQPLSINTKLLKENKEKTQLYYIQYAHARCHQIFQKAQEKKLTKIGSDIDLLTNQLERKIFNLLIRFILVLENIIEENKPHHLIHYLHELAQT